MAGGYTRGSCLISISLLLLLLCVDIYVYPIDDDDDDDGFFLTCEGFGERFDDSFPTCTFLLSFFKRWRSACTHQFHLLRPGSVHSGLLT